MNLITWDDAELIRTSVCEHIELPSSDCIKENDYSYLFNTIADIAEKSWVFISMTSVLVDTSKKFALSVNDAKEGLIETEPQFAFSQLALALQMIMTYRSQGSPFPLLFTNFLIQSHLKASDEQVPELVQRASLDHFLEDSNEQMPLHLKIGLVVDSPEIVIHPLDAGLRLTTKFYQYGCTKKTQPVSLPFLRYVANLSYKLIDFWRISTRFWIYLYVLLKNEEKPGIPFNHAKELFKEAVKMPPRLQMMYMLHYLEELIHYKNEGNYDSPSLEEMVDVFSDYKFPE